VIDFEETDFDCRRLELMFQPLVPSTPKKPSVALIVPVMVALDAVNAPPCETLNGALAGVAPPAENAVAPVDIVTKVPAEPADKELPLRVNPPIVPAVAVRVPEIVAPVALRTPVVELIEVTGVDDAAL